MDFYEEEIVSEETVVLDEEDESLSEDRLSGLSPWEVAFEEGVKMADEENEEEEEEWGDL